MQILKSPAEYATMLVECAFNDESQSYHLLFDAIRAHSIVPNDYWFNVMTAISDLFADK